MTGATWRKLKRLGYDEEFIKSICHFRKDKSKRFLFRVTDIETLSQPPRDGEFICYASFNTLEELSEIVEKLEGFAYEYNNTPCNKNSFMEGGIIDECTYEIYEELIREMEEIQ